VLVYFIFYFEFELGQAVLSRGILMVVRDGTKCTKHLPHTKFSQPQIASKAQLVSVLASTEAPQLTAEVPGFAMTRPLCG
jgi:hypothetical protein